MIELTRLSRDAVVVNCDHISFVEARPDTILTLTSGERVRVLETAGEVVDRVVEFRRRILREAAHGQ
jgi:flagellar protein FlbD